MLAGEGIFFGMILPALLLVADSLLRPFGTLPPGTVDGYAATLAGEAFSYHSAHPTERASLLVRGLDSTNVAVWRTAPVGSGVGDTLSVIFLAAMDVTDAGRTPTRFWLTVDGRHRFAVPQPATDAEHWRVEGADGIALEFRRLMIDKFGDVHGVFTLRVPAALTTPGVPLTLAVHGENVGRMSWFILYTVSMQPTLRAAAEQLLVREEGVLRQTVRLDAWNPLDTATVTATVDNEPRLTARLATGGTTLRLQVPAVSAPRRVPIAVRGRRGESVWSGVALVPVVPRELHLISHSHLDIGYTDLQLAARAKHWRAYDSAMVYIDRSRGNSADGRFRWTVEGLWPLEGYLATRDSADSRRLLDAVRRGDLSLNGFYANLLTGLLGGEELMRAFSYARSLRDAQAISITTAMSSDVPGFTWGLVPALAQSGIRYLSSGPNYQPGLPGRGDRIGNALEQWGDLPFWWMGPSGRDSVLVMTAGRGYSWFHGFPMGRLTLDDVSAVGEYMEELLADAYPWDIVQVRYTIGGDNGVPDGRLADVVREWNARYESPRLVLSTLPQLFAEMEQRHGRELPRVRGDLTGQWEDGALSSAREHVMTRASAARIAQAEALAAIRGRALSERARWPAWRDVLLWDEHTWGADRSISEPDAPDVVAQWEGKQRFALAADSASRALLARAAGVAGAAGAASATPRRLDLWNTHEFAPRGLTILPESLTRGADLVRDASGAPVPTQRLRNGALAVQIALRATGATRVTLDRGPVRPASTSGSGASVSGARVPPALSNAVAAHAAGDSLWNGRVTVHVDPRTGALASVRWNGRELVDRSKGGWARYRYLLGRDTSRAQDAERTRIEVLDDGPLVATLRITSDAPGATSLGREVTLQAGSDAVGIVTRIDKMAVREKESVHLGFPLAVPVGTVRMEQGFAVVRPDIDQVEGANRNVYPVQRWLDASNAEFGVTLVTPDLALWQLNGLTAEAFKRPDGTESWLRRALPGTEFVAYAMNNYWHTNFKADQPGPVTFRVWLIPHGVFDAAEATRAGLDASAGPVAATAGDASTRGTFFTLDDPAVVVSGISPSADGRSVMVRLWNPGTRDARVGFRWGDGRGRPLWLSSPFEERSSNPGERVAVPAGGVVSVRIDR